MSTRKSIFWFEDDPTSLKDEVKVLKEKYDVTIGAQWGLITKSRQNQFDLVLLDLMIHHKSSDYESGEVEPNVTFPDVHWTQTGVEFLGRIRKGEYKSYGFRKDVPVIVATAVVNYPAREKTKEKGISDYLEKPFTITALEEMIENALQF